MQKYHKPKILFIVPPGKSLQNSNLIAYTFPHMGVGYLMSYLKERDIDVRVVDTSLNYPAMEKLLTEEIKKFTPDLIGLSLYSNVSRQGEEIVRVIKQQFSIPIVVGGPHISCTKESFLKKTKAEYGIIKEGERPLYLLIDALFIRKHKSRKHLLADLSKIGGLIYKNTNGDFVINENNLMIEDLDSIPYPDYFSFGLEKYSAYRRKNFTMITSRGCPYQCSYCAAPVCTGRKFRVRSAKNVVDEMAYWTNLGFRNFGISDDSFNQNLTRAKEICKELITRNLGITFELYNGMRANMVDRQLLKLLKQAGCTFIGFGMESGNERILKSIGKSLTKKDMIRVIKLSNEVGIRTAVNFILGHPQETYETAMDTLNFAKALKCSYVNIYHLIPIPGTKAYEQLKKSANFFYNEEDYMTNISVQSFEPIFETPGLSFVQRKKLYQMGKNIRKKSIFQFRFGKILGWTLYILLYNDEAFAYVFNFLEASWLGHFYQKIRRK